MYASVSLYDTDKVAARVNDTNPLERFIVVDLGGLSVYLAGYNKVCAEQARLLADELHAAARAIEDSLHAAERAVEAHVAPAVVGGE